MSQAHQDRFGEGCVDSQKMRTKLFLSGIETLTSIHHSSSLLSLGMLTKNFFDSPKTKRRYHELVTPTDLLPISPEESFKQTEIQQNPEGIECCQRESATMQGSFVLTWKGSVDYGSCCR